MPDGTRAHSFLPRRKPNVPVNDGSQKPHPVTQNVTRMGHPVVSVLDALQAFFSAAVVVEEREGSVVFLGGGAMVALPFE